MNRGNAPITQPDIPAGYYIRAYQPGDGEGWCRCCIDGKLGVEAVSGAEFDRIMTNDKRVDARNIYFLVSEADGVVGTVTYQYGHAPGEAYIHMVAIAKSHWGRGLSRCILAYAVQKILDDGNTAITLTTDDWRLPAIKTYVNCGFEPHITDDDMAERWRKIFVELESRNG